MNLHALVRPLIGTINPDVVVSWQVAIGYTTQLDGTQVPSYSVVSAPMQVQGLSAKELAHLERLNIEGVFRRVYTYGNAQGVVRPDFKGGDLLAFAQQYGGNPQLWKVVNVGRDGKRRFDRQTKQKLVEACLEPSASVAGLALKHGVNANLLRKWIKLHQQRLAGTSLRPAPVGTRRTDARRDRACG